MPGSQRGDRIEGMVLYPCIIPFDCLELGKGITAVIAVIELQDDRKDKAGGQPSRELEGTEDKKGWADPW